MLRLLVSLSVLALCHASPALVWNKSNSESTPQYISDRTAVEDIVGDDAVVFVLQRSSNTDRLTELAPSLPLLQDYDVQYSHAAGVTQTIDGKKPMTLSEFDYYLALVSSSASDTTGLSKKRAAKQANLLKTRPWVVSVDATFDAAAVQRAILAARNVFAQTILTAQRSTVEIQQERLYQMRRQKYQAINNKSSSTARRRRRLEEDQDQQDQDNQEEDNQDDNDYSSMVFVNMTPNILAGILFTLFFATIAATGISCLGAIQGQDVYVTKMPAIGREA